MLKTKLIIESNKQTKKFTREKDQLLLEFY